MKRFIDKMKSRAFMRNRKIVNEIKELLEKEDREITEFINKIPAVDPNAA